MSLAICLQMRDCNQTSELNLRNIGSRGHVPRVRSSNSRSISRLGRADAGTQRVCTHLAEHESDEINKDKTAAVTRAEKVLLGR